MDPDTPITRLAAYLLGEPLGGWVRRHRNDDRSWPWIAQRLRAATGGQVEYSRTHLARLYGEATEEASDR